MLCLENDHDTYITWSIFSVFTYSFLLRYIPVSSRVDKIEAAVHSIVHDIPSVKTALILEVSLKLVIDVFDYLFETKRKQ